MMPWYISLIGWWAGIGWETLVCSDLCVLGQRLDSFWGYRLVEVGWPMYSRGRLWRFRKSTTTRFIIVCGFGGEWSLKGGQLNEFLMRRHREKFPELEEYFFDYLWPWEAGRCSGIRYISSGAATSFSTLSLRMWMSWWVLSDYWLMQHLLHPWQWRYDEAHTGGELWYVCEIGWMTCRKGVWKFVTLTGWT